MTEQMVEDRVGTMGISDPIAWLVLNESIGDACKKLFVVLWHMCGDTVGELGPLTVDELGEQVRRFLPSITSAKLRHWLRELKQSQLIDYEESRAKVFYVYKPGAGIDVEPAGPESRSEVPRARGHEQKEFNFECEPVAEKISISETETETETEMEITKSEHASDPNILHACAHAVSSLQRNKEINNHSVKSEEEKKSVADLRRIIRFDLPKVAALRREVVERVREEDTSSDLIDRMVAAVVLDVPGGDLIDMRSASTKAGERVRLYEKSNGRAGDPHKWYYLAWYYKKIFVEAGWEWCACAGGFEPRPRRTGVPVLRAPAAEAVEAEDEVEDAGEIDMRGCGEEALKLTLSELAVKIRRPEESIMDATSVAMRIRDRLRGENKKNAHM